MARRTKDEIAADALAAAKIDRQHIRVRELLGTIKTAHHARNRGLVVQQLEQARALAIALLEHQTRDALAAARSSEPPAEPEELAAAAGDAFDQALQLPGVPS